MDTLSLTKEARIYNALKPLGSLGPGWEQAALASEQQPRRRSLVRAGVHVEGEQRLAPSSLQPARL